MNARTVEERYARDFGKQDYDNAIHGLWEDHCKYPSSGRSWPPSLEEVKKAVEGEELRRYYENERR